jgi:hypothetical protein
MHTGIWRESLMEIPLGRPRRWREDNIERDVKEIEWESMGSEIATHHVTRHNTPIHNILSTAPQLSMSQKALGTLPEDGNVMSKNVGATIHK